MNVEVVWSPDEVVISCVKFPEPLPLVSGYAKMIYIQSIILNGTLPQILLLYRRRNLTTAALNLKDVGGLSGHSYELGTTTRSDAFPWPF